MSLRRLAAMFALSSTLAAVAVSALPVPSQAAPSASHDWCTPSREHPDPVVMLPGTWSNRHVFDHLRPALDRDGYCTFVVEYGRDTSSVMGARDDVYGTGPVTESAEQVAGQITRVLDITGARKVSLVTHSQGGLIARLVTTRVRGGDRYVDTVVSLASTANGTTGLGASVATAVTDLGGPDSVAADVVGQAALDQLYDSPLMRILHREPNTAAGVRYLGVVTGDDMVATPPDRAGFWDTDGPAKQVWNVDVRDCLPDDAPPVGHSQIVDLPQTQRLIEWALDHEGGRPVC